MPVTQPRWTPSDAAKVNILIVDDRQENLIALEALLRDLEGVDLMFADSGPEALKYLLEHDFDLILLDVQMPGMDGFETARLIHQREKTKHIPIIFLTAIYKNESHRSHGYSVGAVDYIFKPFDPAMLRAKVASFIEIGRKRSLLMAEIGKRQRAEAELLRLNQELEQRVRERTAALEAANRDLQEAARAKDQFLAMLAHELRNPLTAVVNVVELLRRGNLKDCQLLEKARDIIDREAHQLARLVDDLLDVARISTGKITLRKAPVELAVAVARAVETSQPLLQAHRHELQIELPAEPIWVEADLTRLTQVLANLLNNAAKYTANGGQIRLSAEREGNSAILRVRDNGIGIPAEMLAKVFDLFIQVDASLDRAQGGLGVGLSLVKTLVEMHGGSVRAMSEGIGHGSEFELRWPIAIPAPAAADPAIREQTRLSPQRFLIVDDNAEAADSLAAVLRLAGHEARVAYDGPTALAMARTDPPDVAVLDIGLPRMDGYQVAEQLRREAHLDQVRLIALSGYGSPFDLTRSRDSGFDHYLVKPAGAGDILAWLDTPECPPAGVDSSPKM
jgi:signal transduction histidine kinase